MYEQQQQQQQGWRDDDQDARNLRRALRFPKSELADVVPDHAVSVSLLLYAMLHLETVCPVSY
jgi:hypothetical protein